MGGRLCCVMKAARVRGYGSCRWRCHGNADGKGELALGFNAGLECLVSVKRLLEAWGRSWLASRVCQLGFGVRARFSLD